jgi:hypothetical protein
VEELPLQLPPLFAEACGYPGEMRYVAICWIAEAQELWWVDNGHPVPGEAVPFQTLISHPLTAPVLARTLRDADGRELRPWFLIDRTRRTLSVGSPADVLRVTSTQPRERPTPRSVPNLQKTRRLQRNICTWLDWQAERLSRQQSG